jgi:hypothetical protein
MKKLTLLLLILPFLSFTSADWLTIVLDQDASINFYSRPTMNESNGNQVWTNDIDDKARCIVSATNLMTMGMDSATVANDMAKESSMIALGNGMLRSMPGSKLISQKLTTKSGHLSYELVVSTDETKGSGFDTLYCTVIFNKAKMYTLYFWESGKKPQQEYRNAFLNSFKMK